MKRASVYLDSNVLIYLAQPGSPFHEAAWSVLDVAERRNFLLYTSSLGYAEYGALRLNDRLSAIVDDLFTEGGVVELPFGHNEAVMYAKLRMNTASSIGPVDAMHAATAVTNKVNYLVTNDVRFSKLKLSGLHCTHLPKAVTTLGRV